MSAEMRCAVVCVLAVVAGSAVAGSAAVQSAEEFPYVAAVTADDVYVRAGADFRYYPFGRVHEGNLAKVVGEKSGWARVVTLGPAFGDFFGYIRYPKTETGQLRLNADGKTGVTLGPTDLFAPNLHAKYDPKSSWKPMMRLPAERTVRVLQTVEADGDVVHKVAVPDDGQGWINMTLLRRATPAEVSAWEAALAKARQADQEAQPEADDVAVAPTVQQPLAREKPAAVSAVKPAGQTPPAPPTETVQDTKLPSTASPSSPRSAERRLAKIMLEDLEAAYKRLLAEPIETAEVGPLRQLYLDLAKRHGDSRSVAQYAAVRARQLQVWSEVQQHKAQLAGLRAQARVTAEDARAARQALELADDYVAVGRLVASTIYDGNRLPKLLRLRDPATGRTIAYLQPDERFGLIGMLGQRIGIVGQKQYDGGLRLNLIQPRRIDVLADEAP